MRIPIFFFESDYKYIIILIMKYLRDYKGICFICEKDINYVSKKRAIRSKQICSSKCKNIRTKKITKFKENRMPIISRFHILDL